MATTEAARIAPGGLRELGPINWVIAKLGALTLRVPTFHLFNVVGQHKLLFLLWLPFSAKLLMLGALPRADSELVILRVGFLRECEYELQQHRRLARRYGVDSELQARIAQGAGAEGLTERQRVLITATDEFVNERSVSTQTWTALSAQLTKKQLIEFCMLAGQYDALAATMATLRIPLDFPE